MSTSSALSVPRLRSALRGDVIGPEDVRYDDVRRASFTGFDRRPAAVVRAADAADVARVVTLARETGAELAVRSGGHSRAGHGTSDGGIVLDLSSMTAVEVDPDSRTAWAETGVTTGGYTAATGEHGLATGLGDTPTVGLGGIALSGGIGYLVRKHGLTVDDLLAAEVVTADGEILEVDAESHPDLFWALRGGGGNLGVATRLRLRLHDVDRVVGGMLVLPATADVLRGLIAAADAAPEELSLIANVIKAPPLPFIPAEAHGTLVALTLLVYAGDPDAAGPALGPIRGLAAPLADMLRPMRYAEMLAGVEAPQPAFSAGTNLLVDDVAPEVILERLETATAPLAGIQLRVLGGAMARVAEDATAFGHRRARLMVNVAAMYERPEDAPEQEAWASAAVEALSGGAPTGAYVGFLGDEGEAGTRRAYPPATLERLAGVKRRYDPENLFRLNANVAPQSG